MMDVASGTRSPSSTTHASLQLLFELLDEARTPVQQATAIRTRRLCVAPARGRRHRAPVVSLGSTLSQIDRVASDAIGRTSAVQRCQGGGPSCHKDAPRPDFSRGIRG